MDNDGEPDDAETNTEDDDYDEDEDPGELEDYSDEDTDNRDDETTDDSESEHDNKEEEQAVEENEEAADRAENETENADVENADKNVDDAAEFENKNPAENGIEPQTESADANSFLEFLKYLRCDLLNIFCSSFRTLSNAHIICRIQWYLSTILVAFLNQTELISEKVLHISLTKYSTLSRSDLSNFLKYLDKQYLVLLGRISKTTLSSGSVKIH